MCNYFIYTEIFDCGEIGRVALLSFRQHHPKTPVHVYGLEKDIEQVKDIPHVIFHPFSRPSGLLASWWWWHWLFPTTEKAVVSGFQEGHLGTARLWAKLIKERPEKYFIHFDSDVVFRKPSLHLLLLPLQHGYEVVGGRRNYHNNPNNLDSVRHLPDVIQTYFFAFNKQLLGWYPRQMLVAMIRGSFNPLRHPIIDFFDPVSFALLHRGARIAFLSPKLIGGLTRLGQRFFDQEGINFLIDAGENLAHFSSVGSGLHFTRQPSIKNVSKSYIKYALEKYAVFAELFLQKKTNLKIDRKKYRPLLTIKNWKIK